MEQARRGRLFILDKMYAAQGAANENISQYAPRIYTLHIPTDKIRDVIGPGGKVIRSTANGFAVSIEAGCNGVEATIVLIAAIFAFPAPWRDR